MLAMTLGACTGPGSEPGEEASAAIVLHLTVDETDHEDWQLERLELRVDEFVLTAEGPSGPTSVAHAGGAWVSLVPDGGGPTGIELTLDAGPYEGIETIVHLRPDTALPALRATGWLDEQPFELDVTMEIGLVAESDERTLAPGDEPRLIYTLRPDEWLGELDLEDIEPTADVLRIDATHNVATYFDTVERIEESTEARLSQSPE